MEANRQLETYLGLCTQYYDLDKPIAPEEELNFYLQYAQAANGPILEPMCGTGRFLIPFMQAGLDIEGFDASPWMLEALRKKCLEQKTTPNIWEGFLQDLDSPKRYAYIFIPAASFGLITDLEEAKVSLKKIHQHLSDDGIFLFGTETPISAHPAYSNRMLSVTREDGKKIVLSLLTLPTEDQIEATACRYDLIDEDNVIHSENETFKVRLYEEQAMCDLLKQAGFTNIKAFKAFDPNQAPDAQDDAIIYECRK
ncbi:MAG TPA: class I SAM-dependent methyltransferase [Opitutales bacterium]|nr:class I SAM-dependent methyltransferase [Opitutales bacterium]